MQHFCTIVAVSGLSINCFVGLIVHKVCEYLSTNLDREQLILVIGSHSEDLSRSLLERFYLVDSTNCVSIVNSTLYRKVISLQTPEVNNYGGVVIDNTTGRLTDKELLVLINRLRFRCKELVIINKNDSDIQVFKKPPRVVVSLTTVPNRLSTITPNCGIRPCIETLINQSNKNFEIHINIPHFNTKSHEVYQIPQWLQDYEYHGLVQLYRTHDFGACTKLVPTVLRLTNPDDIIVTVDDDIQYNDGFIDYHLKKRIQYPNAALGFAGISSIDNTAHFCTTMSKDTRVKILEGYKTVSYKREFFKDDFLSEILTDTACKSWNDDILFSAYMGKHQIEKYVVNYDKDTVFTPEVESFPIIRVTPNEFGGVSQHRRDRDPAFHEHYFKLGWLER